MPPKNVSEKDQSLKNEMKVMGSLFGSIKIPEETAKACFIVDSSEDSISDDIRRGAWLTSLTEHCSDNVVVFMRVSIFRLTGQSVEFFFEGSVDLDDNLIEEFQSVLEIWMFMLTSGALTMFKECKTLQKAKDGFTSILPAAATLREYMQYYKRTHSFRTWTKKGVCSLRRHLFQSREQFMEQKRQSASSDQPQTHEQRENAPRASVSIGWGTERAASNSSKPSENTDSNMSTLGSTSSNQDNGWKKRWSSAVSDLRSPSPEPRRQKMNTEESSATSRIGQGGASHESADAELNLRTQLFGVKAWQVLAEESPVPVSASLSLSARGARLDLDLEFARNVVTDCKTAIKESSTAVPLKKMFSDSQKDVLAIDGLVLRSTAVTVGKMEAIRDAFARKSNETLSVISKIIDTLSSQERAKDNLSKAEAEYKKLSEKKQLESIFGNA